jgi:hypothetical protein
MLPAMLNRATMRVADTTEVSGRVTADSIKYGLYAKKQGGEVLMKFAQVLVCAAAVGLLSSCASSSSPPQSSNPPKSSSPQSGNSSNYPGRNPSAHERDQRYLTTGNAD